MLLSADPAETARLAQPIGLAFAAVAAEVVGPMITDDSISPDNMTCAIIEAHLLGAASAIASAREQGLIDERDNAALGERAGMRVAALIGALDRTKK